MSQGTGVWGIMDIEGTPSSGCKVVDFVSLEGPHLRAPSRVGGAFGLGGSQVHMCLIHARALIYG